MPKRSLKFRELINRLKPYGITIMAKRGKGSEVILLRPEAPGSKRGATFPIKHHGDGTEIYIPVINAVLRRFGISPKEFWD